MVFQDKNEFITETEIPGLYVISRPTISDERGYFREVARLTDLESVGVNFMPVQFSHSYSIPGTIRAIHTEKINKLVYPISGRLFAAFVDVREASETFGKVKTFDINCEAKANDIAIYVPSGVGNSICSAGDKPLHYVYMVDGYWTPGGAQGIAWDDPDLAINWPVKNPIISERDKNNPKMKELFPDKFK